MEKVTELVLAPIQRTATIIFGLTVGLSVAALALPAGAQLQPRTAPSPLEDLQNQGSSDPFSSRGGEQMNTVMDIIHRAIQSPSQSFEDFSASQRENLDDATKQFQELQRQRLQQRQPVAPPAVPTAPEGSTP